MARCMRDNPDLLNQDSRLPKSATFQAAPYHALSPDGFTIVELLVVIAVIAILAALLLPALQAARESGRRAQCGNNLKNVGVGLLLYHDSYRAFPCGGWGHFWVGVPERGAGP